MIIRNVLYFYAIILIGYCLQIDNMDLLNGEGLFLTNTIGSFIPDPSHTITFLSHNSSNILKLQKPLTSQVSFSNGLQYSFGACQPSHIQFCFASSDVQTQDTNLRLLDSTSSKTIILFRAGKAGLIRVNGNQMISFYNSSVSNDTNIKLTKIDLALNWTTKVVDVLVQGNYMGYAKFFQQAQNVDRIRLYNLYQSTSYWSNLVVCKQNCYNFVYANNLIYLLGLIVAFMLFY